MVKIQRNGDFRESIAEIFANQPPLRCYGAAYMEYPPSPMLLMC